MNVKRSVRFTETRALENTSTDIRHFLSCVLGPNLGRRHQRQALPENRDGCGPTEGCVKLCQYLSPVSTEVVCMLAGIPRSRWLRTSAGGYTVLHVGSNQRVQKRCGSGVKKGKSRSVNGGNGSPKALKESGPVC